MKWGRLYKRLLDVVRRSRGLTRCIFGVRIWRTIIPFNWDVTTLVLKKAIDLHVRDGGRTVLDLGCGHLALLGQYVKRRMPSNRVVGVDIYEEFVHNAAENARLNELELSLCNGNLFEPVDEKFDYITFNPPYVPARQSDTTYPLTAFSGPDGTDTIRRFLTEASAHLASDGRVLLGVNCYHVPQTRMTELIADSPLALDEVVSRRMNTARVFVLRHRA